MYQLARDTLALPFNDVEALRATFEQHGERIAAMILETLPCNMGMVPPDPEFRATMRELASSWGALVIADEVLTGLRATRGGAYHPELGNAAYDFQKPYMELWLGFIGFTDIHSVVVEPTLAERSVVESVKSRAVELARSIA